MVTLVKAKGHIYNYISTGVILKSARDRPGTGNNARRIGILFKSNFCQNYNGI
jgi:hypothetical protein